MSDNILSIFYINFQANIFRANICFLFCIYDTIQGKRKCFKFEFNVLFKQVFVFFAHVELLLTLTLNRALLLLALMNFVTIIKKRFNWIEFKHQIIWICFMYHLQIVQYIFNMRSDEHKTNDIQVRCFWQKCEVSHIG